jgi:hypothetical protein
MDPQQPQHRQDGKRRRPVRRMLRVLAFSAAAAACLAAAAALYLPGRQLDAPQWLRARIEARAERDLNGFRISFGQVHLVVSEGWRPRLGLRDVELLRPDGTVAAQLADARASLAIRPLLRGRIQPKRISLSGFYASLQRDEGSIALSLAESGAPLRQAENLPALIEQWDATLEAPALAALTEVAMEAITLRYEDRRISRVWTLDGGHIGLLRQGGELDVSGGFSLLSGRDYASSVELSYRSAIGDQAADFGVVIREAASEDIAAQAPALAWLGVLRAPISGSLRGGISSEGGLQPVSASLQIGAGVLQPDEGARPVPFRGARSYFSYDPQAQTLQFDEMSVDSGWGAGTAEGQATLFGIEQGRLDSLTGQFRFSDLSFSPPGVFREPLKFEGVRSDFKLSLGDFRLEIGEMLIDSGPSQMRLSADVAAGRSGWTYALDAEADKVTVARIKELWPEGTAVKPRKWVMENLHQGLITGARAYLRGKEGAPPLIGASADFSDASVRFQKHMPPVQEGAGQLSFLDKRFVVMATAGHVQPDEGGPVDIAGTSFIIPDASIRKAAPGVARVKARGDVIAALSLLNRPPLRLMDKSGLPADLAAGQAELEGTLSLPLRKKVPSEEIFFHYTGRITGVESTVLVPGHRLEAGELAIAGDQGRVSISGSGHLSGVPATAVWSQAIGKANSGKPGTVEGSIELSAAANEALKLGLPPGTFSGRGSGRFALTLSKGEAPRLSLTSGLQGLGIRIPPLAWAKQEEAEGSLALTAVLDTPVRVEQLQLDAAGLQAEGEVLAAEGGGLERASFSGVKIGNWLSAPVDLVGRDGRPPEIRIGGGVLDLRRSPFGVSGGGGSSNGESGPIRLALTRLQVTDAIEIGDFRGDFSTLGGFNGSFTGNLNRQAPISGQVVTQANGVATRIRSQNAGAVFRAAGILRHGSGGEFDMTLLPAGRTGEFNGKIRVRNTRVQEAPAMAALLNALSLVGLLDELTGQGILFTSAEADFRLGPDYLQLDAANAIGPSIGLSMDGYYDLGNGALNMRGVISPIYLINAVGSLLTRKGEGLFGFAFNLTGPADSPKVSVNPVSALMPGMFRELFRARPPQAPGNVPDEAADPEPKSRHQPAGSGDN